MSITNSNLSLNFSKNSSVNMNSSTYSVLENFTKMDDHTSMLTPVFTKG